MRAVAVAEPLIRAWARVAVWKSFADMVGVIVGVSVGDDVSVGVGLGPSVGVSEGVLVGLVVLVGGMVAATSLTDFSAAIADIIITELFIEIEEASMSEKANRVVGRDRVQGRRESSNQGIEGLSANAPQKGFEFGKGVFNR